MLIRFVSGAAGQQIERVRQQWKDRRKRGPRTGRTARQVDNQRVANGAADRAAERGKRCVQKTFSAHSFGQAIDEPVADKPGGLWGHVSDGKPSATRRHNKIGFGSVSPQGRGDQVQLIRERLRRRNAQPGSLQELTDDGAGLVHPLATEAAIADRQNDGTSLNGRTWSHPPSVRVAKAILSKATSSQITAKGEKIWRIRQTGAFGRGRAFVCLRNFRLPQPSEP